METTPYLLFSLNGARYAVDARRVREIFWLPELSPTEEAPSYIVGVVNLRGKIEAVMDLDLRFGRAPARRSLTDSVILLESDGASLGVIVGEVYDVAEIPAAAVEAHPDYVQEAPAHAHFIAGEARVGEEIFMLLDAGNLIHSRFVAAGAPQAQRTSCFCPEATAEEREVFHRRAINRMQAAEGKDSAVRTPFAVVGLGGEYFGIELELVREFSHLRQVTPVPCCPPHIAGSMNLRGDILTLVDIRPLLKLPLQGTAAQVVVAQAGELRVGVPVAEVFGVIYLHAEDIVVAPAASGAADDEYCKGVAHYGGKMVGILDLNGILTQGGLEVEEEA